MNPIAERTPQRLVVKLGSFVPHNATCTFDKSSGRARFERTLFLFPRKAIDVPLGDIAAFELVESSGQAGDDCYPRVMLRSGQRFFLSDAGTVEATRQVAAEVRSFLGLAS